MSRTPGWTTRAQVVAELRRRWETGEFLSRLATGEAWQPLSVRLRGPTSKQLAEDFGAAQDWAQQWWRSAAPLRVEDRVIGGRLVGANRVPGEVWVDSEAALWRVLGVGGEVARFRELLAAAGGSGGAGAGAGAPPLARWLAENPMTVLANEAIWPQLVGVVDWFLGNSGRDVYLRQIDVPGVDTKFVERHRGVVCDLLDALLPPERVDRARPRRELAARYGLVAKPLYVRLRRLDGSPLLGRHGLPGGPPSGSAPSGSGSAGSDSAGSDSAGSEPAGLESIAAGPAGSDAADEYDAAGPSELIVRLSEAARLSIPARRVFVVENETTYLAFPAVPGGVVVLGGGYGAGPRLAPLQWLRETEVVYWGDLDTHGFAILDQLRQSFPQARSLLMDRETFVSHEAHWDTEEKPAKAALTRLTPDEAELYRDLVEGRYGRQLRLEQERVRFPAVLAAVAVECGG